ncbi:MAG: circularly permuted type 2 ATP-grasp protein [Planctomycetaceae bacterium]|nr:circularly permuted type 2 ATP-grasp protein [Planctomycetales bacterium]MCB9937193.1 circularly permuted type 2 ATP-grasp protein [Planctomycetaceae bacterium]
MTSVPAKPASPLANHIFDNYSSLAGVYDEMFDSAGAIRASWKPFAESVEGLGREEISRRWQQAQEEVRENGITYNAYEDVNGNTRPWELDAFPLVIAPQEWAQLTIGLRQRAELLDRILRDLFGPQTLLQQGLLPADWLFSHPGFHREFHRQGVRDNRFLHLYAVDLARAPDGRWWVAGDRTDAPLGVGYALENRVVMSRMLPKVMRDCKVERLASFFISLRKTLGELAPHRENPRIVILTHGPTGPNYFEDAYLARYLGYTLVEGGDLAVRDDRVFMKTLAGLLPVDVIFRRLSDEYCDPLELGGDPTFGVPGLLQAARLGNVTIANSLGSSIVESPSLIPFLPRIAREWMGEELRLPSAATWWCGQKPAQIDVRSRLGKIAVRAAFRVARREAPPPESLWSKSPDELSQLIDQRPRDLIGQENVARSCAPVWNEGACESQRVALRVFLIAADDSYHVMPGGLVCMAGTSAPLDLSVLAGEVSKDAWVVSDAPVQPVTLLSSGKQAVALRRSGAELPSRVADNLFWLGRHVERAQNACRLLRPVANRLTSESGGETLPDLSMLVHSLAQHGLIEPGFAVEPMRDLLPTISQVLPASMLDATQPDSLRSMFRAAHKNATLVRDRLSLDSWRVLHRVEREFELTAAKPQLEFGLAELLDLLNDLIGALATFDGLIGESMTRTPAWRFLELGRRLERSLHTIGLVQSLFAMSGESDTRALEAALEVADSMMTYRSRYLASVNLAPVLDLLLTDETNPRSLVFQLEAISEHVEHLPRDESQPLRGPDQRIALSMLHSARMLDLEALQEYRATAKPSALERALGRLSTQLPKLSNLIGHRYLIHADVPQQMSESRRST